MPKLNSVFLFSILTTSAQLLSPVASADCSYSWLTGDPLGILTNSIAFSVVNTNPPAATFLLSDLTPKGVALPTGPGPASLIGTPFNDFTSLPYGSMAFGLNAGRDVFLLADRQQDKPGYHEVDVMEGGRESNGGQRKSLFILGDAKKTYYAGKARVSSVDRDYAYINNFSEGKSKVRLHGNPSDYRLTWLSGLFAKAIAGTAIVTRDTCDVIGFVRGRLLTDIDGPDFEYATPPSPATALNNHPDSQLFGIDQIGSPGDLALAGKHIPSSVDEAGNLYMAFGASSTVVNGTGGAGSFFLVKYDADGNLLWTRKHGTQPSLGPQIPQLMRINNGNVFLFGMTYGPFGGAKPPKAFTGSDGGIPFLAKFNQQGELVHVTQPQPVVGSAINGAWAMEIDSAGDLYLGGSVMDGLSLPMTSPYVMKVRGEDLTVDTSFGNAGSVIFRNGPVTLFTSLNLLADTTNNLQIANFTLGIGFAPDNSGQSGEDAVYIAGVSDNGSFFGSDVGWNNIWYTKLEASTGQPIWLGNYACNLLWNCGYTGGYSLSAPAADSFLWAVDVDSAGNLYLGGETGGSFNEHGHSEALVVAKGSQQGKGDGFVAKINSHGTLIWLKHIGTHKSDNVRDILINQETVLVLGETYGDLAGMRQGKSDVYTATLDATNGETKTAIQFGSERYDIPGSLSLGGNQLFITGGSEGSVVRSSQGGIEPFVVAAPLQQQF